MGITWHGNYLKYFELARCALFEKIDFSYSAMAASDFVWPIVDVRVKYVRPTRFEQHIVIYADLVEYEHRVKINYRVCDKISGEVLTKGHTLQVAVEQSSQEMCYVSPSILIEKLQPYIG
ncbi:acyl-CoA thioesterase [Motilimonas sp. E26]|nr:acyl-CoA thioesterase [Motilimonas sp. E26]